MITSEKTFYRVLLVSLAVCVALYAEETVHFMHYGWRGPDTDYWINDVSKCQQVRGSNTDFECLIAGYGLARYRYEPEKYHGYHMPNQLLFVDRIQ